MSNLVELTPDLLRTMALPQPEEGGDKDDRGRALIVGGSLEVPGAALLAATSALRAGAGKLQIATLRSLSRHMAFAAPEALVLALDETEAGGIDPQGCGRLMEFAGRAHAVLLGPGMTDDAAVTGLTARLLDECDAPALVLDAACLKDLPQHKEALARRDGRVVITPHAGEMASLMDMDKAQIERDPLPVAVRCANDLGVVTILKGSTTHVAAPDGRTWVNRHGTVGLATSGSGDTLAGIITALLARGAEPAQAALWGVYAHAEAGARLSKRVGAIGFLAREIPGEIPAILTELA